MNKVGWYLIIAILPVVLLINATIEESDDDNRQNLVIVFDGLRSDFITPELMPNLYGLGQDGVVADNHHVVYPPVTRVNAPSLATGSYPGTHGFLHNQIFIPSVSEESIHTGDDIETLRSIEPLLTATSFGEWLDQHDLSFFTGSSGSYGSAFLLNHTLASAGVWNSRGFIAPDRMKTKALEQLGDLPEIDRPNYAQNRWVIDAYLHTAVDKKFKDAAILWITDPDRTTHTYGIGASETKNALKHVDDELGRLLAELETRGKLQYTNIFITTDHGFSTHEGGFDLHEILHENELNENVRIFGNTQIYLNNEDHQLLRQIVRALQEHPAVGAIFTRANAEDGINGIVEGTFSMNFINYDHDRSADILVTAAWNDDINEYGYAGISTQPGVAGHGTTSPFEIQTKMIAFGPDIKKGIVNPVPTGNIDITPTILHLLGLPIPDSMEGRVMSELLIDGPDPETVNYNIERYETEPVEWNSEFKIYLYKARTGEHAYLHKAGIER